MSETRVEFRVVSAHGVPVTGPCHPSADGTIGYVEWRIREADQLHPENAPYRVQSRAVTVGEWEDVRDA